LTQKNNSAEGFSTVVVSAVLNNISTDYQSLQTTGVKMSNFQDGVQDGRQVVKVSGTRS